MDKKSTEKMTLEQKIALCSGKDFWHTKAFPDSGIPSIMLCDGPHGLRKQENAADMLGVNRSVPATCFPTASLSACSFDTELLAEEGHAIAAEAAAQDVAVVLGPGVCLKRNPLCGRNFEYFSEDPYLAGKLAAGFIQGLQENGAAASLKHFACNSQETKRFSSDSVLDMRTLRELYLPAFEIAVKEAAPKTVMCSYNKINGVYSSDNKALLTDILRKEWGFRGVVVTDWGAMHDRTAGFRAGCDLMMPGGSAYGEKAAAKAVKDGILPESYVTDSAERVAQLAQESRKIRKVSYTAEEHHALARKVAENSIVLLKNENDILPLHPDSRIALIGKMAEAPRYQGAGSSHIRPTKLTSLKDAFPNAAYAPGCDEQGNTTEELLEAAAQTVAKADVVILAVGLTDAYESEGFDRESMQMPQGHLQLVDAITKVNPHVVVILCCGSAVETPWADTVQGIVYAGLSGQAGGEALANILTGKVNPSGRLAETWPLQYTDCPSHAYYGCNFKDGQYREGIYIGYRYYDKADVPVRFTFGCGLSYTQFTYTDLQVHGRKVSVTVTNIGSRGGKESVLCYVCPPQDGIHRPVRELKRFCKIELQPGESKTVEFTLDDRCFAVWHEGWQIPGGRYTIEIGGLTAELPIDADTVAEHPELINSWYQHPHGTPSQSEWEKLIGRPYHATKPQKGAFTMENTVMEMRNQSLVMRIMYYAVESVVAKGFDGKKAYDDPDFRMMMAAAADCSMSSSQINGGIRDGIMQGMVEMANGHYLRGILRMVRGE